MILGSRHENVKARAEWSVSSDGGWKTVFHCRCVVYVFHWNTNTETAAGRSPRPHLPPQTATMLRKRT